MNTKNYNKQFRFRLENTRILKMSATKQEIKDMLKTCREGTPLFLYFSSLQIPGQQSITPKKYLKLEQQVQSMQGGHMACITKKHRNKYTAYAVTNTGPYGLLCKNQAFQETAKILTHWHQKELSHNSGSRP